MPHFLRAFLGLFLYALLGGTAFLNSQEITDLFNAGKNFYEKGNYFESYTIFSHLVQQDSMMSDAWFYLGKSARELSLNDKAYECFKQIIWLGKENYYPSLFFDLAEVSRSLEKYEEALAYYEYFLVKDDSRKDEFMIQKSKNYVANKADLLKLVENVDSSVEIDHLPMPVNTPYSEFGAFQREDTLFFTSIRPVYEKTSEFLFENDFGSAIYFSNFGGFGYKRPQKLNYPFNDKKNHTANLVFNPFGTEAWFNICYFGEKNQFRCDLYSSQKQSDNTWTKPIKLPFNLPGYTTTQPAFAKDSLGQEIIFFSSDRPGGYGGLDIWYVVRKNSQYGQPINAGSFINSPGNEMSPFYDTLSNTLYFSSDYWIGLGGFDIFRSKGSYSRWEKPVNVGRPINSPSNDVYFKFTQGNQEGYLTSNRKGSYAIKGETCCYDIYTFEIKPTLVKKDTFERPSIDTINMTLKNKIQSLLPINLYFHNDYPDPRSKDSLTQTTYDETYEFYLSLIEKFKKEYSKGLEGDQKQKALEDMERFFTLDVVGGYERLIEFLQLMREDLQNGSRVTITIQGFTSPLTTTEYNLNLAKRRIKSLINFMKKYQQGFFQSYLESDTPKLRIIEKPVGEVLADPTVSDNPHDARNSIYSIKASKERRIQISSYQSTFSLSTEQQKFPVASFSTHDLVWSGTENIPCKTITIQNVGTSPLVIKKILSSHSWVEFYLSKSEILPSEKVEMKICVDLLKLRALKMVLLFFETNEPSGSQEVLYIRAG
ncbi:MAG: hypothetical protein N2Z72_07515 [Bacteroidales bacterium]|nr:hypothetical protein [Bacteroidales bacterium]